MLIPKRRITKAYLEAAVNKYTPLIHKLAFRLCTPTGCIDELKSIAIEEVLKSLICYNNTGSFMTLLYFRLSGTFRHIRDREIRANRMQHLPTEVIETMQYCDIEIDSSIAVDEFMNMLSDKEKYVINGLYIGQKTMREVAKDLGLAASTIYHIKERALSRIRDVFIGESC